MDESPSQHGGDDDDEEVPRHVEETPGVNATAPGSCLFWRPSSVVVASRRAAERACEA
jgi:hypothetical protein